MLTLRPKEVCEKLGISYTTLREYVRRGWIKPVVLESGKWRFTLNGWRPMKRASMKGAPRSMKPRVEASNHVNQH